LSLGLITVSDVAFVSHFIAATDLYQDTFRTPVPYFVNNA
jgi:hypothetical protein